VRRGCLGFLDHYANEASPSVFALALRDPVELVRHAALHSLACETCRTEELCVADVVPHLVEVLFADTSPELRHKAVPVLLRSPTVTLGPDKSSSRPPTTTGMSWYERSHAARSPVSTYAAAGRTSAEQGARAHQPDATTPADLPQIAGSVASTYPCIHKRGPHTPSPL
jgi:hypothetical protein